ncbi:MAG: hypothetical protein NW206_01655 [Hyphomonadaceae bacterium]|nr:hypothetical protein [Hyphomonadaceae bacterium]
MFAPHFALGAIFASRRAMSANSHTSTSLRAEARLLATAGIILLVIGFPLTMTLAMFAMQPDGVSPILPIVIGAPPLTLGYLACHLASRRMERAKALDSNDRDWQPAQSAAS